MRGQVQLNSYKHSQHGVGLIEVLVTLVILSVGLLGVAALQFTGSFANKDAISRTQADIVASQIVERLRVAARPATVGDGVVVNNQYFSSSNYNFAGLSCTSGAKASICYCQAIPANIPDCESGECNEAQMAQYDGWAVSCAAIQTNPQTQVSLSCADNNTTDIYTCSAGSRVTIQLRWPVNSGGNTTYNLNSRCNPNTGDSYNCVVKDVTL